MSSSRRTRRTKSRRTRRKRSSRRTRSSSRTRSRKSSRRTRNRSRSGGVEEWEGVGVGAGSRNPELEISKWAAPASLPVRARIQPIIFVSLVPVCRFDSPPPHCLIQPSVGPLRMFTCTG